MENYIIDTNVPLKATDTQSADAIDRLCAQRCFAFIKSIMDSDGIIALDAGREIIKEYEKNIVLDQGDNVASEFLKWLYHNLLTGRVAQYSITKTGNNSYAEFPDTPALAAFDRSDRKFVALAKAHPEHPSIYNGSDTDWWEFKGPLEKEGIHVFFLCEEYMRVKCKGSR